MQLVILAAGMGSRFGGLKQMEPMDDYGNFLLDYSIVDAKKAGFDGVVFIIKKDFYEAFRDSIGKRVERLIKVEYAFQDLNDLPAGFSCPEGREKPWGTAHAIYAARKLIKDDFIIINGDDFYGPETYQIAADYLSSLPKGSKGKYANVAFYVGNTMSGNGSVKRGVLFTNDKMELTKLVESSLSWKENGQVDAKPLDGNEPFVIEKDHVVSMNLFCFNPDLIAHLEEGFPAWLKRHGNDLKAEYLIPDVVDELVSKGEASVAVLVSPATWHGVTYKEDKPEVVKALAELTAKGYYKEGLY